MSTNTFIKNALHIEKDPKGKKITIKRDFDATPDLVWRAWTESELLEQWWAPKPYRVETKHMDFKVGGYWFYAMVAPDDSKHYARANYTAIEPIKRFEAYDSFCDEEGNPIDFAPSMSWKNEFKASNGGTQVTVQISFQKEGDLEKIMEMGFETGFTAALSNLEHYLNAGFKNSSFMQS